MDELTPVDRTRLRRFMSAYHLSDRPLYREWGLAGTSRLLFARWLADNGLLNETEPSVDCWLSRLLSGLCSRLAASRDS